jgi:DnaJ-class molecular chaperone
MSHGDGGKGSGRRKEDASKVRDNWDLIFGAKAPMSSPSAAGKPKKDTAMNEHDEHEDDGYEICHHCSGSGEGMYDGSRCGFCHGTGEAPVERDCDDFDIPMEDDYDNN